MRPKKPAQPAVNVAFEPVRFGGGRYEPLKMTAEQSAAMRQAAVAVIDAYRPLLTAMVNALHAQRDNCGNKSTWTVSACHHAHSHMEKYVKELLIGVDPVEFPALPPLC